MTQSKQNNVAGLKWLAAAFLIFMLLDVAALSAAMAFESVYLGMLTTGLVLGEVAVFAVWGTLGPNPLWVRWPLSFAMLVVLLNGVTASIFIFDNGPSGLDILYRLQFCLPLTFLAAQAPLWLGKAVLNWRLHPSDSRDLAAGRPFSIVSIMLATLYFGLSLALVRFAFMDESEMASGVTMIVTMYGFYAGMWTTMFAVPGLMGVMMQSHTRGSLGVILGYYAVMLLLPLAIVAGVAPAGFLEPAIAYLVLLSGGSLTYLGFLFVLKSQGYFLQMRLGKTSSVTSSVTSSGTSSGGESPFRETSRSPFASPHKLAPEAAAAPPQKTHPLDEPD